MNEVQMNELKQLRQIPAASLTAAQVAQLNALELAFATAIAKAKEDSKTARTRASATPVSTDAFEALSAIDRDTLEVSHKGAILVFDNMSKDGKSAWYTFSKGKNKYSLPIGMAVWKELEAAPQLVEVDLVTLEAGKTYRWVNASGDLVSRKQDELQLRTAQGSYPKPVSLESIKAAAEIAAAQASLAKALREMEA